ncbi:GNAT family N-acetyltransferase [Salinispora pacifica]|uniref:GNAT family N-acetyltransferase n=1 Tax=Salinispora pacifica TaxID=351187 RepID=UPI0003753FDD|nr:GNAT family N-acetyltransferase [Salinispora pacifica]
MTPETIDGPGIRLRLPHLGDIPDTVAACSDPLVQQFLPALPSPYTEADARWWITEGAPAAWAGGGAAYAITDRETDRLLGTVGLNDPAPSRQEAAIGYWVAPWARGRGVATAATQTLADRAFASGIRRLELLTVPENIASQRVALAAGFRPEGVRRLASRGRDGERADLLTWARLADDPPGPVPRLLPDLPDGRLTDGVVELRPRGPQHAKAMYHLHTQPETVAVLVPPEPPRRADIERNCREVQSQWLRDQVANLVIIDASSGATAGICQLVLDHPQFRQGMVGYGLLPAWRGLGYASRAVRLLAEWGFTEVRLGRIWADTHAGNIASERVLERAGFHREGRVRGRFPAGDGPRRDSTLFGLLPGDLTQGNRSTLSR